MSYWTLLAIWDHTVLPATRHKWTRPSKYTQCTQRPKQFRFFGDILLQDTKWSVTDPMVY